MFTWKRSLGHRDGSVITAYETKVDGVEYAIESRWGQAGREYRTFRVVRGRFQPASQGGALKTLTQAKAQAEIDYEDVVEARRNDPTFGR